MRRFLAFVGLILAIGGFVLLMFSMRLNIHFLIPVGMIVAAFLILTYIKKMPSELDNAKPGEEAFAVKPAEDQGKEGEPNE